MKRKTSQTTFARILVKVGNPPVRLVSQKEFREIAGCGIGSYLGRASPEHCIITVRYNAPDIISTMWHELAHILFPNKPHWWIECFAAKITGGDIGRYSRRYAHHPTELPSRNKCLEMAHKAAERIKQK